MALAAGMSVRDFYDATPRDVNACIKAYYNREKVQWERTRTIAFYAAVGPHMKPPRSYEHFMRFSWDKPFTKAKRELTEQDKIWLNKIEKRGDKIFGRDKE